MMYLVTTWYGSFLCGDEGIVKHTLFPSEPAELAKRLKLVEDEKILGEERKLVKGHKDFLVNERRLEKIGGRYIAQELEIDPSEHEPDVTVFQAAMVELGKLKVRTAIKSDEHLVQAVNAVDDLIQTNNLLSERLHKWYSLYFPELERLVKEDAYISKVAENKDREALLADLKLNESIGGDASAKDRDAAALLAKTLADNHKLKAQLEKYIESGMSEMAPNVARVIGPNIGARLISHAGSLERLARMPSSTIQLLGAEKA